MTTRLVATDLDGTLLRDDGSVSDRTALALAGLEQAGIHVVFVTARPMRWMQPLIEHVGGHGLAIVSNGAVEYDLARDEILAVRGLAPTEGLLVTDRIRQALPQAAFAIETVAGFAKEAHYVEGYPLPDDYQEGPIEHVWAEQALKLLVRYPPVGDDRARPAILAAVGSEASVSWSTNDLVEIAAAGVTKAAALAHVCELWQIDSSEVMAFGDMPNDLEMLRWAGTSYAMANGDPLVRAAASAITTYPNNEDGVARVLEGLLSD